MKHKDFKVVPCKQNNRDVTDLWEIRVGGNICFTTVRGRERADEICEMLNEDPYALERGQDRMSRGGAVNYPRKDF